MRGKNLYFAPAYTLAVVLGRAVRGITRRLDFRIKRALRAGQARCGVCGAVRCGVEKKPGGLVLSPKKGGHFSKSAREVYV